MTDHSSATLPPARVPAAPYRGGTAPTVAAGGAYFFLWRFFRNRFLRLCVAIFFRFRLRPFGIVIPPFAGLGLSARGGGGQKRAGSFAPRGHPAPASDAGAWMAVFEMAAPR